LEIGRQWIPEQALEQDAALLLGERLKFEARAQEARIQAKVRASWRPSRTPVTREDQASAHRAGALQVGRAAASAANSTPKNLFVLRLQSGTRA
jgi:hypothetical protein